jgi:ribosome biogenesis GTPase
MSTPSHTDHLAALGWTAALAEAAGNAAVPGTTPARVIARSAAGWRIAGAVWHATGAGHDTDTNGDLPAEPSGRLRFAVDEEIDLPVVGDWVMVMSAGEFAVIHEVLPRTTLLVRHRPGAGSGGQALAANVDRAFIVQGLDRGANLRGLERYLVLARESGAVPAVVLNKADTAQPDEVTAEVEAARAVAGDIPVIACSSVTGEGIDRVRELIGQGVTACFLGASGVGKSTIIRMLLGRDDLAIAAVREADHKGRHTTTARHLFVIPNGGMVIDTPGMRELGIMEAGEGLAATFPEIIALAEACRFRDCMHGDEPGCAVRAALDAGEIDPGRFESYSKLVRESALRSMGVAERHRRDKNFGKMVKEYKRIKSDKFGR